jgi:hypothetical protein
MPSWCARTYVRVSPGLKDYLLDAENFCLAEITIAQRLRSDGQREFITCGAMCDAEAPDGDKV